MRCRYQSDFARRHFEAGYAEGKAEGFAEGFAEGKAEAMAALATTLLRHFLHRRGLPIDEEHLKHHTATADPDLLFRWLRRIDHAQTLEAVFAAD